MLTVRRTLPSAPQLIRKPGKPTDPPRPLLERLSFKSPPSSDLLFRNCHLPMRHATQAVAEGLATPTHLAAALTEHLLEGSLTRR